MQAKIRISQTTTSPDGEAKVGVTGVPVFFISADNAGVARFEWEVLDIPDGSTVATGLVSAGMQTQVSFTPDLPGAYLVELRVFDTAGRMKKDRSALLVPETVGAGALMIPPWLGDDANLNYAGQKKGWAKLMRAWLKHITTLGGGGGGGGTPDFTDPVSALAFAVQTETIAGGGTFNPLTGTRGIFRFTGPPAATVESIAKPVAFSAPGYLGRSIVLMPIAGQLVTLLHMSAGATNPQDRIDTSNNGLDLTITKPVTLTYDVVAEVWRVVSGVKEAVGFDVATYSADFADPQTITRTSALMHISASGNFVTGLNLPTTPQVGDMITIKAKNLLGGNSLLVGANDGAANYTFTVDLEAISLIWDGTEWRHV